MSIKEISRRSFFDTDDYGISGIDVATAEIVIEDNGQRVYLLAQWVSEAPDMMHFESTFESTYDLYEKMMDPENDSEALCNERDRVVEAGINDEKAASKYPEQRKALVEMVKQKLLENDIDLDEDFDEED